MTTTLDYSQQFLDSQDYWSQVRGQPCAPAPTFREVNGKQMLGRYVDPYGALTLMQNAKDRWSHWYPRFLISVGIPALIMGVDFVYVFLALPIFAAWYLIKRAKYRRLYDSYYNLLQEIERTGQPQWVPFNKDRLRQIDRGPGAAGVWP